MKTLTPASKHDLHLMTTDVLLSKLVSGQELTTHTGEKLSFSSDDTRNVLNWYRMNVGKWAGNLTAGDTESIIDTIGASPPTTAAASEVETGKKTQLLRLKKIVAHRFGGLHAYGRQTEPPKNFVFEPTQDMTLFEGANGSGKTSIANAVIWCLTGHLIRSQREPEPGPTEFMCDIKQSDGSTTSHMMSSVTPMPDNNSEESHQDATAIPADTWVELTFVDQDGNDFPPLKRVQNRNSRGKLTETTHNFESYGVDPIAWRIASTMPALLPFLPVGSNSQLGEAVARLTGLADLVDLSKHAAKANDRILKRSIKDLDNDCSTIEQNYDDAQSDVAAILEENEKLQFEGSFPKIDEKDSKESLETIDRHFLELKTKSLDDARSVLGDEFDSENKSSRDDLERNIHPAILQIKSTGNIPSISRLSKMEITQDDIAQIAELRAKLIEEANTISQLVSAPETAIRDQLYARVVSWMNEHNFDSENLCAICYRDLEGVTDPVTDKPVTAHLKGVAKNSELLSKTLSQWSSSWVGELLRKLPRPIVDEARKNLPTSPQDLIKLALGEELFKTDGFQGILSSLRSKMEHLLTRYEKDLPAFEEPPAYDFPKNISQLTQELNQLVRRIDRALAFAEWRTTNKLQLREFMKCVCSGKEGSNDEEPGIKQYLETLLEIVEGVAPLNNISSIISRMQKHRDQHSVKQERIKACNKAATALREIVPLGELAEAQVSALQNTLHIRSEHWRKNMYRNATVYAPSPTETRMNAKGVLELNVGREGVSAPAQHVSNASALRGSLLGFFLAFREYVLNERGGLLTLVLDDPQELLDNDNRERLARGVLNLTKAGAQMLVTTHDRLFARSLVAEHRKADLVEHFSVHPVNGVRPTLELAPAIEEVDRKRTVFRKNPDDHISAQDYAADLRVFLESRLGDLFDNVVHPAYSSSTKALTLFQLLDRLRGLISNSSNDLFQHPILNKFVNDISLTEGHEARRILNQSHHDKASITYADVKDVAEDFQRLRTGIEEVHEQFRFHRWREPLATEEISISAVEMLEPALSPNFSVPIYPDIAAFTDTSAEGPSQDTEVETLNQSWFDNKSFYYIRSESLGFAIPSGAVAIVESEPYPGGDQDLVIAHYNDKIFARRLIKPHGAIGVSLTAQVPNPLQGRPSLTYDASKLRLHRIVGAIFTDMPPPEGKGEATFIEEAPELSQIQVAYRVKEDSAIPLALPNQTILGGQEIARTNLEAVRGKLVALTLNDGSSLFKRVGSQLPGKLAHLRQFETIGGLGSSQVVATSNDETYDGSPSLNTARHVLGVLYI
ncbi:MAG: AAA family ATPase [Rhodospirillales bacterium]|nr:AAA family ATPase [Rhodospirillales bacterium]